MRDILTDLETGSVPDPQRAAQQAMKTQLPKRFYAMAAAEPFEEGFRLTLDGRPARTPGRAYLSVPTEEIGAALAAEWAAQTGVIDPATMPLTRLANVAIDRVGAELDAVSDEIVRYSGADLLCYRAEGPPALVERQGAAWDPVLTWARKELGARFVLSAGIRHVEQSDTALAAIRAALPTQPLPLAALHVVTTLTGSALLGLGIAHKFLTVDATWQAAHVDEDWNIEQWGLDAEAERRRRFRLAEMQAAGLVLTSLSL
jgi:chaperone required for assembly of F1-ATPase